jgi:hypothetical protein
MAITRSSCCSGMFIFEWVYGGKLGVVCLGSCSFSVFRGLAAIRRWPV